MDGNAHTTMMRESLDTRLDAIARRLDEIVERQARQDELLAEFTPIARDVLANATTRFAELERKGYFAFGREAARVAQRVIESYSADDVRRLGDAVVGILDTVRALTQPEVLGVAARASEALREADRAAPVGLFGAMRATRDADVQRGMSVMLELLRQIGHGAAPALARTAEPAPTLRLEAPAATRAAPAAPSCATPRAAAPVTATVIDGVAFTADGHLVDPKGWSLDLGARIAQSLAVELTDAHWSVIKFARAEYLEKNASPNIRRITQALNITTKSLYTLFPKAPARTVAKIAGIPKPVGCL